jgi:ubiquitin carboxyl-terminal hydrolase 10
VLIEALPPVLVIHLKRFLYDAATGDVIKISKSIQFGPELEIPSGTDFLLPPSLAVVKG